MKKIFKEIYPKLYFFSETEVIYVHDVFHWMKGFQQLKYSIWYWFLYQTHEESFMDLTYTAYPYYLYNMCIQTFLDFAKTFKFSSENLFLSIFRYLSAKF